MAQAKMKKKIFQGRYEILNIVGRGSCSVVYHGKLLEDDKSVALKVLVNKKSKENLSDRLRQEALSLVSARHKHVIRLDDFHSIGDLSYLAMEFAPHADLATYISNQEQELLPVEQTLNYIFQIAEALSFVHKIGMLHRDIKPSNILIMSSELAKLGDFGVALLPGETTDMNELQKGVGTIDYMAPEVFEGKVYNQSSDIYQLGVTAYEILSGKNPFNNSALVDVLNIRKDENLKPINGISSQISKVILKALSYDFNDRYQNVDDFLEDLKNAKENKLVENSAPPKAPINEIESKNEAPHAQEKKEYINISEPKEEILSEPNPEPASETPQKSQADKDRELEKEKEDFFAFMEEMQRKVEKEKKEKAEKERAESIESEAPKAEEKEEFDFLKDIDKEEPTPQKEEDFKPKSGGGSSFLEKALAASEEQNIDQDNFDYSKKEISNGEQVDVSPRSQNVTSDRKPSSSLLKIIIILGLAYFAYTKFYEKADVTTTNSTNNYQEVEQSYTQTQVQTNTTKILPVNKNSKSFNFPNLQSGTYAGEINNLIDGAKHPITLISEGNGKVVSLLIGINGFQPISTKPDLNSKTLVFRTNGFMLEFEAEKLNGFLRGTYTNLINKKTGRWYLKNILNN